MVLSRNEAGSEFWVLSSEFETSETGETSGTKGGKGVCGVSEMGESLRVKFEIPITQNSESRTSDPPYSCYV